MMMADGGGKSTENWVIYREKPILNDGHISQERLGDLSGVVAIDLQQLRGGEKIRSGGSAFEGKDRELD